VLVFSSAGEQVMTVRVNHNYGKIALQIILHSDIIFLPAFLLFSELTEVQRGGAHIE
jgi:hypothetical protein